MSELTLVDTVGGNTNSPTSQHRSWCFTINNYQENTPSTLHDAFTRVGAEKWVFSREVGHNGTPHIQGWVHFKNGKTFNGVKIIIGNTAHIEVSRGTAADNYKYCTKSPVDGLIWEHGWPAVTRVTSPIIVPRPFQKHVIDLYNAEPHDRKIYWFWDAHGNSGKTALAKHLCLMGKSIYVNGKASDVKCGVAKWIADGNDLRAVIFGIPRTVGAEYVSYAALEEVKDGIFYSGKYESGMVMYKVPHVFVFANFPPDTSKLSSDRWVIMDLETDVFHNVSPPLAEVPPGPVGPQAPLWQPGMTSFPPGPAEHSLTHGPAAAGAGPSFEVLSLPDDEEMARAAAYADLMRGMLMD